MESQNYKFENLRNLFINGPVFWNKSDIQDLYNLSIPLRTFKLRFVFDYKMEFNYTHSTKSPFTNYGLIEYYIPNPNITVNLTVNMTQLYVNLTTVDVQGNLKIVPGNHYVINDKESVVDKDPVKYFMDVYSKYNKDLITYWLKAKLTEMIKGLLDDINP